MNTLTPHQNYGVDISAIDFGGNPAPVTNLAVDIDNHALAYVVLISSAHAIVVARGPLGVFNLLVTGFGAGGSPIIPLSIQFQTIAGDAATFIANVGPVANDDITTPGIPAGW